MSTSTSLQLQPGRKLGRHYQVIEFLGEGFEGEVYKIEEISTGIIRAAKFFYTHPYAEKFPHITYAKRLYNLRHCPIVIQYHHQDVTKIRGEWVEFLVSDFVDGMMLSHYIDQHRQQRISPFEALHLFYALVQGVEHIHFLGDYHGDIHLDNVMIKQKGLHFEVHLIDLMHLGRPTRARIQADVVDLISVLYEMIGGQKHYAHMPTHIKKMILGRKHQLIAKHFKTAADLRIYLENFEWQ